MKTVRNTGLGGDVVFWGMKRVFAVGGTWSARTSLAGQAALKGEQRGLKAFLPFMGPALIASVAYMDPGNFATNIQGGSKYGYSLLWVVLLANSIAMLLQALSAKLGIVTGESLARHCRNRFSRPVVWCLWGISEIGIMATDLAEFLGGAIGFSLLFHIPLFPSLCVTGLLTWLILTLQRSGFRPLEVLIGVLVGLIGLCYGIEIFLAPLDMPHLWKGMFIPQLVDQGSLALAVGIVGATVMPHAIFLHSSLFQGRIPLNTPQERRRSLSFSHKEVVIALAFAGLINMAMVSMAASVFHGAGLYEIGQIETAYYTLIPLLGPMAASVFMISLLASGVSSSVVGTLAGQNLMRDFSGWTLPLWVRRLITMIPTFVVVGWGVNATDALVISQIILSLVVPIPMILLVWLTSQRQIMGEFVNSKWTTFVASVASALILSLNMVLLLEAMGWSFFESSPS